MQTMQNFECALKMSFMMHWNLDGAFLSQKAWHSIRIGQKELWKQFYIYL
jgi:hypothetical protein